MFNQMNIEIFNAINSFAGINIILDKTGIILAKYTPFIFILFLIYLWFKKNSHKNIALYSGYSAIVGLLLNFLISLFYFHPRPFMDNTGKLLIDHSPNNSFPSDHTTFMLSIAFLLLYFRKTRKAGILFSVLGVVGGLARVFSGIHYPFDIFGSVVVAIISSYIIFYCKGKLQKLNNFIIDLYFKIIKTISRNT